MTDTLATLYPPHEQPTDELVTEILEALDELGVRVEARLGGLLFYTPRRVVGGRLRALMLRYKAELLERLERRGRGAA